MTALVAIFMVGVGFSGVAVADAPTSSEVDYFVHADGTDLDDSPSYIVDVRGDERFEAEYIIDVPETPGVGLNEEITDEPLLQARASAGHYFAGCWPTPTYQCGFTPHGGHQTYVQGGVGTLQSNGVVEDTCTISPHIGWGFGCSTLGNRKDIPQGACTTATATTHGTLGGFMADSDTQCVS